MAIKKSDLYSSLWASCDELRGGMDASQYKDYVLFMLFIKYVSDKYGDSDDFAPPVTIPKGAGFKDMIALKGNSSIGDKINTQVIQPLIDANSRLARTDFPDFNDPNKLGEGQAMVERLSNLIAIFQKPELDFSQNRADNDDILGDAYEYLMRHFATDSGKSKGQFYTPSEVSRVIAKVIGISPRNAVASTTAYDPTCGSGSLLLKVAAELGNLPIRPAGMSEDVVLGGTPLSWLQTLSDAEILQWPVNAPQFPEDIAIVRDRICRELGRVDVPTTWAGAHSEVRRLRRTDAGRQERQRRKSVMFPWEAPCFDSALGQRQLRILNAILLGVARVGGKGQVGGGDRPRDKHCRLWHLSGVQADESCSRSQEVEPYN